MEFLRSVRMIDASIIVVYLVISFIVGLLASRLLKSRTTDEEGYFLAGRNMPGWLTGISNGVTAMNADVAPTYTGMMVGVGIPLAWFYMSRFGLAWMIAALLFAIKWRQLGVATAPAFYRVRFGGHGGTVVRVWSSIYTVALGMIPWVGVGLLGVHMIFGPVFGIEDKAVTLAIILPALLIYVWISGFAGVLMTDVIQTIVILVASLVIAIKVLAHYGGPTGLAEALAALPFGAETLSATPVPGHMVLAPAFTLAWFLVATVGAGGNLMADSQRVLAVRDEREAMKVYVWAEVALFAMLLLLTLPALGLLPKHPELYLAAAAEREKAYGMLLDTFLPTGLLGLALAALTASVMSTIDSHLNYGAQTLTDDVWRVIFPRTTQRQGVLIGRLITIAIMVLAVIVMYRSESLIGIAVLVTGLFGSTLTFFWGQWWWWRANFPAWCAAMLVGPCIYFGLGAILPHWDWWQAQLALGPSMIDGMNMIRAVMSMVISTTAWVVVALLTRPEDKSVLMEFYRRARPLGWWGPIREAVLAEDGAAAGVAHPQRSIAQGFGLAFLGAGWIGLGVMGFSQIYVGRYATGGAMLVGAVAVGILFRRMFDTHYRNVK